MRRKFKIRAGERSASDTGLEQKKRSYTAACTSCIENNPIAIEITVVSGIGIRRQHQMKSPDWATRFLLIFKDNFRQRRKLVHAQDFGFAAGGGSGNHIKNWPNRPNYPLTINK